MLCLWPATWPLNHSWDFLALYTTLCCVIAVTTQLMKMCLHWWFIKALLILSTCAEMVVFYWEWAQAVFQLLARGTTISGISNLICPGMVIMFPPTSEQQGRAGEIFCHGQNNKTVPERDSVSVMVVCSVGCVFPLLFSPAAPRYSSSLRCILPVGV